MDSDELSATSPSDSPPAFRRAKTLPAVVINERLLRLPPRGEALRNNYEKPTTGRENWWRKHILETPLPGAYRITDFLAEMDKRPGNTAHGMRSSGRARDVWGKPGLYLQPGASNFDNLFDRIKNDKMHKGRFKGASRSQHFLQQSATDKDINVAPWYGHSYSGIAAKIKCYPKYYPQEPSTPKEPQLEVRTRITTKAPRGLVVSQPTTPLAAFKDGQYDTTKYFSINGEVQACRHSQFRSTTKRFHQSHFEGQAGGPGPGQYELPKPRPKHVATACFKSQTGRFVTAYSKVPGPGSYDRTDYFPKTRHASQVIRRMATTHGLFFSPNYVCSNA